jgi:hypothetical protein
VVSFRDEWSTEASRFVDAPYAVTAAVDLGRHRLDGVTDSRGMPSGFKLRAHGTFSVMDDGKSVKVPQASAKHLAHAHCKL